MPAAEGLVLWRPMVAWEPRHWCRVGRWQCEVGAKASVWRLRRGKVLKKGKEGKLYRAPYHFCLVTRIGSARQYVSIHNYNRQ